MIQPIWAFCHASQKVTGIDIYPIYEYTPENNQWRLLGNAGQPSLSSSDNVVAFTGVNDPVKGHALVSWFYPVPFPGRTYIDSYDQGLTHQRWADIQPYSGTVIRYANGSVFTWRDVDDVDNPTIQVRDPATAEIKRTYIVPSYQGNTYFDVSGTRLIYGDIDFDGFRDPNVYDPVIRELNLTTGAVKALTPPNFLLSQFPDLVGDTEFATFADLAFRSNGEIMAAFNVEPAFPERIFVVKLTSDGHVIDHTDPGPPFTHPNTNPWMGSIQPITFDIDSDGWWGNWYPDRDLAGIFPAAEVFVDAETLTLTNLPNIPYPPLDNIDYLECEAFVTPPHIVRQVTTPIANDLRVLAEMK